MHLSVQAGPLNAIRYPWNLSLLKSSTPKAGFTASSSEEKNAAHDEVKKVKKELQESRQGSPVGSPLNSPLSSPLGTPR